MDKNSFGEKIRDARISKGMTQRDLASIIGVTPESVSYYERDLKRPSFDVLKSICNALVLSIEDL